MTKRQIRKKASSSRPLSPGTKPGMMERLPFRPGSAPPRSVGATFDDILAPLFQARSAISGRRFRGNTARPRGAAGSASQKEHGRNLGVFHQRGNDDDVHDDPHLPTS